MSDISIFFDQVWSAPILVWSIAAIMSFCCGYLLNTFVDNGLFAAVSGVAMFVAIMIAQTAFYNLGIFFTTNPDTNIVAAGGAAVCSLSFIAILIFRLLNAAADFRNRLRGQG